jgi:hypothetical protein
MNYKLFFLISFILTNFIYASSSVMQTTKSLHSVSKTEDYVKALKSLGAYDSILSKYSAAEYAGSMELMEKPGVKLSLFTKDHFVRSETFREDIDGDSQKEYVSQVVFATGSEKLDRKIYFVFIHDDDTKGNALIYFKVFDELLCDHTPTSPVTFEFAKQDKSASKNMVFKIIRTQSCGDQIDYYSENDTLMLNGKPSYYREGKPYDAVHINRSDELEELNLMDK